MSVICGYALQSGSKPVFYDKVKGDLVMCLGDIN